MRTGILFVSCYVFIDQQPLGLSLRFRTPPWRDGLWLGFGFGFDRISGFFNMICLSFIIRAILI